jgi:hypothetical protein
LEQQYLTIWDLVLTPLYLVVLTLIAKYIRNKYYPTGHPLRRYFLPGLFVKFGGAIFIALIYQYYYGSGDTFSYFKHTKIINSSLDQSFSIWVKLLLRLSPESDPYIYRYSAEYTGTTTLQVMQFPLSVLFLAFSTAHLTCRLPCCLHFFLIPVSGLCIRCSPASTRLFTNPWPLRFYCAQHHCLGIGHV